MSVYVARINVPPLVGQDVSFDVSDFEDFYSDKYSRGYLEYVTFGSSTALSAQGHLAGGGVIGDVLGAVVEVDDGDSALGLAIAAVVAGGAVSGEADLDGGGLLHGALGGEVDAVKALLAGAGIDVVAAASGGLAIFIVEGAVGGWRTITSPPNILILMSSALTRPAILTSCCCTVSIIAQRNVRITCNITISRTKTPSYSICTYNLIIKM